jgi:predicted methyltransferase
LVLILQACSAPSDDAQAPAPEPQAQADLNPSDLDQPDTVSSLAAIIAHPRRAEDASRDQFRNPLPTLEFFDVQPDMQVAEIWPGWYTPILGPYLAETGQYTAVLFPDGISERIDARNAAFKERYDSEADFGTIAYGSFSGDAGLSLDDDSVDMILTFRNVHNWMGGGYAEAAFAEFYRALKPGGILGVVEHRLPETQTQDPKGSTGYVQESYMKALAADAGFEFVESSEVNANPLDTADHPFGVWTLPPRSRTPEEGSEEAEAFDADFYRNIGESDRATLKFRKPE